MIKQFKTIPTPAISDAMGRYGSMTSEIKTVYEGAKIAGPAVTVLPHVGDNLMVHKAIQISKPGDIVVGDDDGVIVVPKENASLILEKAKEKIKKEAEIRKQIEAGKLIIDILGLDKTLKEKGVVET